MIKKIANWCKENLEYDSIYDYLKEVSWSTLGTSIGTYFYLSINQVWHMTASIVNAIIFMLIAFLGPNLVRYYAHKYKGKHLLASWLSNVLKHDRKSDDITDGSL